MITISYSAARENLAATMDQACDDHEPVVITRQKQRSVVVLSLDDYKALEETVYLLKSPTNARRLLAATKQLANLLSELQMSEQPQYLDGTDKTSLGATQREFMQKLFSEHTGDKKRVIEEYAKAEVRGEIKRKRNRFGVTPKQYAYQLFADGMSKGWLQK